MSQSRCFHCCTPLRFVCPQRKSRPASAFSFFFNDTGTTEIYTLSLHDALPIRPGGKKRSFVTWKNYRAYNPVMPQPTPRGLARPEPEAEPEPEPELEPEFAESEPEPEAEPEPEPEPTTPPPRSGDNT